MGPVGQILLFSTQEEEQDGGFDVIRPVDRRGEGLGEELKDVATFRELVDVSNVRVGERRLGDATPGFGREEDDIVGDQRGATKASLIGHQRRCPSTKNTRTSLISTHWKPR